MINDVLKVLCRTLLPLALVLPDAWSAAPPDSLDANGKQTQWEFSAGESFAIALTPMAGMAFGRTAGIVPALEMSLGYGMFDFYGEGEYLIDVNDKSGSFFYSWLELGVTPTDLFRGGLAAQRTRVFESPLEVDRGLFAQINPAPVSVSVYAFSLLTESWFMVGAFQVAW